MKAKRVIISGPIAGVYSVGVYDESNNLLKNSKGILQIWNPRTHINALCLAGKIGNDRELPVIDESADHH